MNGHLSGACPGIRKGGGGQNLKAFLFCFIFSIFQGDPQKIAEKMIFSTKIIIFFFFLLFNF